MCECGVCFLFLVRSTHRPFSPFPFLSFLSFSFLLYLSFLFSPSFFYISLFSSLHVQHVLFHSFQFLFSFSFTALRPPCRSSSTILEVRRRDVFFSSTQLWATKRAAVKYDDALSLNAWPPTRGDVKHLRRRICETTRGDFVFMPVSSSQTLFALCLNAIRLFLFHRLCIKFLKNPKWTARRFSSLHSWKSIRGSCG